MKRIIENTLLEWKEKLLRKPLLIRGARQIGKTFIIRKFGKEQFSSFLEINFEEMRSIKNAFDGDLTPSLILRDLSARLNTPIIPGETLLFLDEIQACPNALTSLRFFYEKMPELHVIGAGSLLEFILGDGSFSFPVGRIEYCYMRPLSFIEFLEAKEKTSLLSSLHKATVQMPLGSATHAHLIDAVREYFIVGGMPEAVRHFLNANSYLNLSEIHQNLLNVYENDLGKYPKTSQVKFMRNLFAAAPLLVCEHFKYAKIHPHAQSRDYLESIQVLSNTGLLLPVYASGASGIPLESQKNEKKFKLLFLDIGLLPHPPQEVLDSKDLNKGNLAEQFAGQELVAYTKPYNKTSLFFWEREKTGSSAEVDYVITVGKSIIPIEVKSGKTGKLRSLKIFMEEKNSPLGIRISQNPLSLEENILSVPFYMIQEIPRLVEDILK